MWDPKSSVEVVNKWRISCIVSKLSPTSRPRRCRTQEGPALPTCLHLFLSHIRKWCNNNLQYTIPSSKFLGFGSLSNRAMTNAHPKLPIRTSLPSNSQKSPQTLYMLRWISQETLTTLLPCVFCSVWYLDLISLTSFPHSHLSSEVVQFPQLRATRVLLHPLWDQIRQSFQGDSLDIMSMRRIRVGHSEYYEGSEEVMVSSIRLSNGFKFCSSGIWLLYCIQGSVMFISLGLTMARQLRHFEPRNGTDTKTEIHARPISLQPMVCQLLPIIHHLIIIYSISFLILVLLWFCSSRLFGHEYQPAE